MGQYWRAAILDAKTSKPWIIGVSYDYYHCSAALIDHAHLENIFPMAIVHYIYLHGPLRLVWVGDYAEGKYPEHWKNPDWIFTHQSEQVKNMFCSNIWAGDEKYIIKKDDAPKLISADNMVKQANQDHYNLRWIHNITKDQWLDLDWYKARPTHDVNKTHKHPLCYLTAVGDTEYRTDSPIYPFIGSWAGDLIEVFIDQDPEIVELLMAQKIQHKCLDLHLD